jgi:hypothetical protein
VLDLGRDRNVINPEWLEAVSIGLEEVVGSAPPRGLVTTGSNPDGAQRQGSGDLRRRPGPLPVRDRAVEAG